MLISGVWQCDQGVGILLVNHHDDHNQQKGIRRKQVYIAFDFAATGGER